ncbi:hypothetical protein [Kitasatospora sp. NPDC004531]
MKARILVTAVVAALLFGPLVTGCSTFREDKPVAALDTAKSTIDALLDGATKAITPAVAYRDVGYSVESHIDWAHDPTGKARLTKQRVLEPRIADGKAELLMGELTDYWKAQGFAVTRDDTARRVGAAAPGEAWATVTIGQGGVVHLEAGMDPVKDPGTLTPFKDQQTPEPSPGATRTPAGEQDDPYWSH